MKNKKRVCYVVCYKDPEYIRTRTLVAALQGIEDVHLLIVKNKYRNLLRYLETPARLAITRMRYRPDIYIVGFRGHEIFWAFYPSMIGKKIIFDEFINLHDWLVNEHHKLHEHSFLTKLTDGYMKWVIKKSDVVLEDTDAHAKLSAQIYGTPLKKIRVLPVGADERLFYPRQTDREKTQFEVLFFGSMLPLHGLDIIMQAIRYLVREKNLKKVHFSLVGGKGNPAMINKIQDFIKISELSDQISYKEWVDYQDLPAYIAKADLCLGGPFGNTGQARRVITGKTYQFMAMAKPVVIGRIEDMSAFKDKQNCLIVEQADPAALAGAIAWAMNNIAQVVTIGEEGRKLYKKNFSQKVLTSQMQEIIGSL